MPPSVHPRSSSLHRRTRSPRAPLVVLAAIAGALATTAGPAAAQAGGGQAAAHPDTAARRAAMDRLAFLVGDWSGDATSTMGPGQRLAVRQTERVRRLLGGQVLVVEGVGRRLAGDVPGDTVFHALGVIDWTPERGYLMRASTLAGQTGDFPLAVRDSGFTWSTPAGAAGRVEYTMRLLPDGTWDERGAFVRPDGQSFPVFAMQVRRTGTR